MSASARLDAELLLGEVLGVARGTLYVRADAPVPADAEQRFAALVARRAAGYPMAYLLGRREFWSTQLTVTGATLIPRPETEHLVDACVALVQQYRLRRVLDLGTGSGAVAIAVASECPACEVTAVDISGAALAVARSNVTRLQLRNVALVCGDWLKPLARRGFDVIVSNPPYVCSDDPCLEQGEPRYEPRLALDGGADGLDALRTIVAAAPFYLAARGWLLLEHGAGQGAAVRGLLCQRFRQVETRRDYSGQERISVAYRDRRS